MSFFEAVKELAAPAGIVVEERQLSDSERRALKRRATLYDVLEAAASFYESKLWTSPEGIVGRDYLKERAMTLETCKTARLGWAPNSWTSLVDHLHTHGYDARLVIEAGLAKEARSVYDTFRARLVFPIRDDRGRVIGFGGRILEGDGPKYLNSPETRLYHKSKVLYGLYMARKGMQRANRAIVVEGYFDVLALHQAGFHEAVATCGTALTVEQMERLRRHTQSVDLLLDADEAGSRAAERSLPLFLDTGVQAWRLQLPNAKDPDELIRNHGPEGMEQAMKLREPLVEWVVQRKLSQHAGAGGGLGAQSREQVVDELLPLLARLPGSLVSRVAARLGVHEASLRRRLANQKRAPKVQPHSTSNDNPPEPPRPRWKPTRNVVHLLWLLVHRRDQVSDVLQVVDPTFLEHHPPQVTELFARLLSGEPEAGILPDLDDPGVHRTLQAVIARDVLYEAEDAAIACCQIIANLSSAMRRSRVSALSQKIAQAASADNLDQLREYSTEKSGLMAFEKRLDKALNDKDVPASVALLSTPPDSAGNASASG
ncbi:MAG: DNA primase [Rhodobacterales bacterium]|nr:DNA primase [Rhodobacterales bacterium]